MVDASIERLAYLVGTTTYTEASAQTSILLLNLDLAHRMNPSEDIKAKYTWLQHAHGFASNLRSVKGTPNISTSHLLKWATVVAGPCTGIRSCLDSQRKSN